jgi:hypothetical protein
MILSDANLNDNWPTQAAINPVWPARGGRFSNYARSEKPIGKLHTELSDSRGDFRSSVRVGPDYGAVKMRAHLKKANAKVLILTANTN